jgi:uncharacterized protein (TIGR02145 family)
VTATFNDSRDGNVYRTSAIGTQTWLAVNLAYLPTVCPCRENCGYWVYDYNGTNVDEAKRTRGYMDYGVLYDWKTATTVCPAGWHLSSESEWNTLLRSVGGVARRLKATSGWNYAGDGNNDSGFAALPGGGRNEYGPDGLAGNYGNWWTSTEDNPIGARSFRLFYRYTDVGYGVSAKSDGKSVRCVKDN